MFLAFSNDNFISVQMLKIDPIFLRIPPERDIDLDFIVFLVQTVLHCSENMPSTSGILKPEALIEVEKEDTLVIIEVDRILSTPKFIPIDDIGYELNNQSYDIDYDRGIP